MYQTPCGKSLSINYLGADSTVGEKDAEALPGTEAGGRIDHHPALIGHQ